MEHTPPHLSTEFTPQNILKYNTTEAVRLCEYIKAIESQNKSRNDERILMENYIKELKIQLDGFRNGEVELRRKESELKEQIIRLDLYSRTYIEEITEKDGRIASLVKENEISKQNIRQVEVLKIEVQKQLREEIEKIVQQNKQAMVVLEQQKKEQADALHTKIIQLNGKIKEQTNKYNDIVSNKDRRIRQLEQTIQQYTKKIRQLQAKISEAEQIQVKSSKSLEEVKIGRLTFQEEKKRQIAALNAIIIELNEKFSQYQEIVANQQSKIGQFEKKIEQYRETVRDLKEKIFEEGRKHIETVKTLEKERKAMLNFMEERKIEVAAFNKKIKELSEQLEGESTKYNEKVKNHEGEIWELQEKIQQYCDKIKKLEEISSEAELKNIESSKNLEEERRSRLMIQQERKSEIDSLNKRIAELNEKLNEQISKYKGAVSEQENTVKHLQQEVKQKVKSIKQLQEKIGEAEQKNIQSCKTIEEERSRGMEAESLFEEKIKHYEQKVKNLETMIQNLANKNSQTQANWLNEKAKKLQEERKLREKIKQYEETIQKLEEQIELHKQNIKNLQQKVLQVQGQNEELKQSLREEEEEVKAHLQNARDLQQKIQWLTNENGELKQSLSREQDQRKQREEQVLRLEEDIRKIQQSMDKLNEKTSDVKQLLQDEQRRNKQLEKQNSNLLSKIQKDQQHIHELEQTIEALRKSIQEQQTNKAVLHENLSKAERNYQQDFQNWKKKQFDFQQFIQYVKNNVKDLHVTIGQQNKELYSLRNTNERLKTEILEGISKLSIEDQKQKELTRTRIELAAVKGKLAEKQRQMATSAFKIGLNQEQLLKNGNSNNTDGEGGLDEEKKSKISQIFSQKQQVNKMKTLKRQKTFVTKNSSFKS